MASGILEVSLVDAEDLKEKDLSCWLCCLNPCFSARRPYVLIQYGSQEHISCVAQEEGKKEVWDEKFRFNVKYEGEKDHTSTKLILRIMDKNRFSSDKTVGETTIYVKDVVLLGMEKGKMDIEPQKYRVVRSDKTYTGQISVALIFTKVGNIIANDDENKQDFRDVKLNEEICET